MKNILARYVTAKSKSLIATAAKMENDEVLYLATRFEKSHGKGCKQAQILRNLVAGRQRHFNPFA